MNHIPMILLPVKTKGDITLARDSIAHELEKQFPRVGDEIKNHVKDGRDVLDCLITNLAVCTMANDQLDKELKEVNDANQIEIEECNKVATKGYGQAYEIIETQKQMFQEDKKKMLKEFSETMTEGYEESYQMLQDQKKKSSDQIASLEDQVQQLQQALAMARSNR